MILYQYKGGDGVGSISPPCLKVDLALRKAGAGFEVVNCMPATARKVSRTGRLPALRFDDGVVLDDSIVILDELERRYPEIGLAPADPAERRVDLLWDSFLNDHVYWYGFWLRWADPKMSPLFADAMFARQPWWFRTFIVPAVLRRQKERLRHQGFLGKSPVDVRAMMVRALDLLVEGVGDGPFLQGRATPGRGDLAATAMVVQTGFRGSMPDIETEVRARPTLIRHAAATYRACNAPPTRWLAEVAPAAEGATP